MQRFGTLVIDYICFFALSFVIGAATMFFFGNRGLELLHKVPEMLFGSILIFAYYVVFESIWSRTPGKWVFGTIVTDDSGGKPSVKQVLGRTACRFIPFEAFSFLGERRLHDTIPDTRVVRCR
jgi:uncharacterized RDD family membrane protein YckC